MSVTKTGNVAHDLVCNLSEMQRQIAVAAALTQSAVKSAEITHYRNVLASCKSNNNSSGLEPAVNALRQLGVWT